MHHPTFRRADCDCVNTMHHLILTASDSPDPKLMGGKAAALAELSAEGLAIPPWFVIVPNALNRSLTGAQRNELSSASDPTELQRIVAGIQPSAEVIDEIANAVHNLVTRASRPCGKRDGIGDSIDSSTRVSWRDCASCAARAC